MTDDPKTDDSNSADDSDASIEIEENSEYHVTSPTDSPDNDE